MYKREKERLPQIEREMRRMEDFPTMMMAGAPARSPDKERERV